MDDSALKNRKEGGKSPEKSESSTEENEESSSSTTSPETTGNKAADLFHRFVTSFEGAIHNVMKGKEPTVRLPSLTLEGIAEFIQKDQPTNIIVMTGAGISTAAGIPDFRSPNTGLYDNLGEYNLSDPMDIFSLDFFLRNPEPFYSVAKKLFPKDIKPTPAHHFVKLLHQKKMLRRWFTQNIDSLEHATGIPDEKIVEAHGSHRNSTCLKCRKKYNLEWMEAELAKKDFKYAKCECGGVIKPDITFFGEGLPKRFFDCAISDFPKCDLLIIMGTSLVVQPFASMIGEVSGETPRLLINLEPAGQIGGREMIPEGLCYGHKNNTRDVFWKGTCDEGVKKLCDLLDWEHELEALIQEGQVRFESKKNLKAKN